MRTNDQKVVVSVGPNNLGLTFSKNMRFRRSARPIFSGVATNENSWRMLFNMQSGWSVLLRYSGPWLEQIVKTVIVPSSSSPENSG